MPDAVPDEVARLEALLGVPVGLVAAVICDDSDVAKAVRGGVAERVLADSLAAEPGVVEVRAPAGRGTADREAVYHDGTVLRIEAKHVDSAAYANGSAKLDMRRGTPGRDGRLYRTDSFDIVAACLYNRTGTWEWRYKAAALLRSSPVADGEGVLQERIAASQHVDGTWRAHLADAIADAKRAGVDLGVATATAGPERIVSTQLRFDA